MKKNSILLPVLTLLLLMVIGFVACQKDNKEAADTAVAAEDRSNPNSAVYPPTAQVNGKSYGEWTAEWWRWATGIPCATNPINDPSGANAGINQSGPNQRRNGHQKRHDSTRKKNSFSTHQPAE
jgi:hypothetical protein